MVNEPYLQQIKATPDDVLLSLRDEHRQACQLDDACDRDIVLNFKTTVAEWRIAQDLLPTKQLGRSLNVSWGLSLSDADWKQVLAPEKQRTLREVCELISKHAQHRRL